MKNKEFHKFLKKNKSNSGFTLTELLVGLIMGTIVIGGLGFGLVHLLRSTRTGTAFTGARNESARALDFISDEVKRAVAIENTAANANLVLNPNQFDPPNKTVVFALDIPEVNSNADPDGDTVLFGVDDDIATMERIVYFLQAAAAPWQGPLVLYRWGPPLDGNGNYTDGAWAEEALIDGIDNTTLLASAIQCDTTPVTGGQITSPATPTGFYACIQDDDLDGNVEPEDTDSIGISAELYLTSGVDVGGANLDTYTANTQVVARARVAPGGTSEDFTAYTMSYRTLNPRFACNSGSDWSMRTDFGDSKANPSNLAMWDYKANRQPQPINITGDTLVVSSVPFGATGECLNSRVNNGRESSNPTDPRDFQGNKDLTHQAYWDPNDSNDDDVVAISHEINFNDPRTFNGDPDTCTAYPCGGSSDGKVLSKNDGTAASLNSSIIMLKHGSEVPDYGGYDANNDGVLDTGDQVSLGEFLANQSPPLATADGTHPSGNTKYVVTDKVLPNERIIAFEVGHESITNTNPGVDFQDNAFIVSSDAFTKKYSTYEDNGSTGNFSPLN